MKLLMVLLAFLAINNSTCGQQKTNPSKMEKTKPIENFIKNFSNYTMDIQAAGIASLPTATLSDAGELYIEYAYNSAGEKRNGKMTLQNKGNNRYEGNWKTDADNGNSYQGSLYFVFSENGEGFGFYKFSGSDYKITILKK